MAHKNLTTFRRRLFTAVSAISFLFCLTTVALWVRSYKVVDGLTYFERSGAITFLINSVQGRFDVERGNVRSSGPSIPAGWRFHSSPANGYHFSGWFGAPNFMPTWKVYWFPIWLPAILFAIAPTYWFFGPARRRAKRHRLGLCEHCGYDLRASPDRCPECGSLPVPSDFHKEANHF